MDPDPVPSPAGRALAAAMAHGGVLSLHQALDSGLSRGQFRHLATGRGWVCAARGTLVVPDLADDLLVRARACVLSCPGAVVAGITAARVWGLHGLPPPHPDHRGEPIHLVLPSGRFRAQRPGVVLRWRTLQPGEVTMIDDLPITTVERTIADVVLGCERHAAISVLDAAIRHGRLRAGPQPAQQDVEGCVVGNPVGNPEGNAVPSIDAVKERVAAARRGGRRREGWFDLVDGRAAAPLESRLRLLLVDAGLIPEDLQHVVADGTGHPIARLDLAWPSRKLGVEADDPEARTSPEARFGTRVRQNALTAAGWAVLCFTWDDYLRRSPYILAVVGRRLARQPPPPRLT